MVVWVITASLRAPAEPNPYAKTGVTTRTHSYAGGLEKRIRMYGGKSSRKISRQRQGDRQRDRSLEETGRQTEKQFSRQTQGDRQKAR